MKEKRSHIITIRMTESDYQLWKAMKGNKSQWIRDILRENIVQKPNNI